MTFAKKFLVKSVSAGGPSAARGPMAVLTLLLVAAFALPAAAAQEDDDAAVLRPSEILKNAPEEVWRPLDLENTILLDLPSGEVVIELRPDFAPQHVARIKELVREKFYDGLLFHRVVEGFVAQGGDPKGDGTGGSTKPDLPPEFTRDTANVEGFTAVGRDRIAARVGFVDGMPAAAQPESMRSFLNERLVQLWGVHCPGVMSMARAAKPDSANSQFFLMIGDARLSLDRRYTTWGWIVDGFNATRRINRGEPPDRPTPIVRMRIAADVPDAEKPKIEVMRTDSQTFIDFLKASGLVKDGFVRDLCNIKPPRRVNGAIKL